MVPTDIICKECGAKIEVKTWKKFVICPFCESKNKFEGFEYKKIDANRSMYAHVKYEQDCPVCRSSHMFSYSLLGKWRCIDCGYMLSGIKKVTGILWFCDNCETYMNIQAGFSTKKKKWICSECGFENDVSRKNTW